MLAGEHRGWGSFCLLRLPWGHLSPVLLAISLVYALSSLTGVLGKIWGNQTLLCHCDLERRKGQELCHPSGSLGCEHRPSPQANTKGSSLP